jgi:hypothetical protein
MKDGGQDGVCQEETKSTVCAILGKIEDNQEKVETVIRSGQADMKATI